MTAKKQAATNTVAGGIYGLGLIGALVYYMQHVTTFWSVIVGLFKTVFWPAYLVWHLMTFLHM